jgi:hypothetical protein
MSKAIKEKISGRVDPDLLAAVDRYCQANRQTRSDVLTRGLRWAVTPEYQEERERVVAETLDRIAWQLARLDGRVRREMNVLQEMLGLFVRAYYNHTPKIPEPSRNEFRAAGKERFDAFMQALAENVGPGRSMLEQVPAWAKATQNDRALVDPPQEKSTPEEKADDRDV